MEYYSEYIDIDDLSQDNFSINNLKNEIELKNIRKLFDNYKLQIGQKGRLLVNHNGIIPGQRVIQWKLNYNCFTLIRETSHKILVNLVKSNVIF